MRSLLISILFVAIAGSASALVYQTKKPILGQSPYKAIPGCPSRSLQVFYSDAGRLSLSVDAMGTGLGAGSIQVERPDGGIVRRAFLIAASTGFSGYEIRDGDVRIEGTTVVWHETLPNSIRSWNALADVTAVIKPRLDACAGAGRIPVEIEEQNSAWIDGVILVVVFEDPNEIRDRELSLFFGASAVDGDHFTIEPSRPVAGGSEPIELGVGISFGMQTARAQGQYSVITVNGSRLTSCAGGPDDGSPSMGALITVGGIGDDTANPGDPFAEADNLVSDDEYYDLRPFVRPGDRHIEIETRNPSKDENLMFASFSAELGQGPPPAVSGDPGDDTGDPAIAAVATGVSGGAGGAGVSIGVSPAPVRRAFRGDSDSVLLEGQYSSRVGQKARVTARVVDVDGNALPGIGVQLNVLAGPHLGAVIRSRTDDVGEAVFYYRGIAAGTDSLLALVSCGEGRLMGSNLIGHRWNPPTAVHLDINPGTYPSSVNVLSDEVTAALLGMPDFDVSRVEPGSLRLQHMAPVRFSVADVGGPGDAAPGSSNGGDGVEDLVLHFRTSDLAKGLGDADGTTRPVTMTGRLKDGSPFQATCYVAVTGNTRIPSAPGPDVLPPITAETVDGRAGK